MIKASKQIKTQEDRGYTSRPTLRGEAEREEGAEGAEGVARQQLTCLACASLGLKTMGEQQEERRNDQLLAV